MRIIRYHPRAVTGDGGMSGAIRRWSESTAALGADMTIAYDDGVSPGIPSPGVRWVPVKNIGRDRTRFPLGLQDVLREADLLVLHSGWTLHNVRAAQLARSLKVPYLLEPRGAYDPRIFARNRDAKKAWWTMFERKLVHEARGVHVFLQRTTRSHRRLGYRGKYVEASNGIDAPVTPQVDRRRRLHLVAGALRP